MYLKSYFLQMMSLFELKVIGDVSLVFRALSTNNVFILITFLVHQDGCEFYIFRLSPILTSEFYVVPLNIHVNDRGEGTL